MPSPHFDPSHAVHFDVRRGCVTLDDAVERLLVPADALLALCRSAGDEALMDFGRRLGTEAGRRVAFRLEADLDRASPELVIEHLGGELSLLGLGSLGLERWGRALMLTLEGSPFGPSGDELVAGVLEGALARALSRNVRVVPLVRSDNLVRLLLVSLAAAQRVRGWLGEGLAWGEILTRLHQSGGGHA